MGFIGAMAGLSAAMGVGSAVAGATGSAAEARAKVRAAETSKILEAAFFDDEVNGIIAESARLVGKVRAEAGVRGVKSTTGTAAERVAEVRRAETRELRTAAQESVITRYGFTQAGLSAKRAGKAATVQGGLGAAGAVVGGVADVYKAYQVGKL